MADHMRQQIVAAWVSAVTGLTTTGSDVFQDRDTDERPLQADELPGLVVEDDGDPSEIVTLGTGRILERTMRIRNTAHVKAQSSPGATLNLILKEIEVAIAAANLAGAKYATLVEVAQREVAEGAETKTVRQAFTFEVLYYTAHNTPDVAL